MADRLTQVQLCLDQLVAQFNATINYVNSQSEMALLDDDPNSVFNIAANAPQPGKKEESQEPAPNFNNVVNELSTDIILKARQISMIIDSLPGIGTLPNQQLDTIRDLIQELKDTEAERTRKIEQKDELLGWCDLLIMDVSAGIYNSRS